jgi:glucarate dehydratase
MIITDLKTRTVAIPLTCQLRHNTGVHPGYFLRTIVEVHTDEGITGLGEVGGGDQRGALEKLKPRIIGLNPFDLETLKLKVLRAIYYLSNARLYGALEIACLDIQGKAAGVPVHQLLGGKVRNAVPMIAYLFWRYDRPGGGDDTRAEDLADWCEELRDTLGVQSMKLKAGVMDPMEEVRVLQLCRERLGSGFGLRIDPNGVWSVPTAVKAGKRMEDLEIEYFEDPSWGLEGMRRVREQVRLPLATNMFPAKFDDLAPAIRTDSIDIILTDLHYWEGPRGVKDLAAICRTFKLGVAMHSGAEFGIELAAMLHTAATIPEMNMAGDAHYHYLEDDIIQGGKLPYNDGALQVPEGPGLGVELDEEKMEKYERFYQEKGDYYARFHQDPKRPGWHPMPGAI